jgi:Glycosyl transferase family 2
MRFSTNRLRVAVVTPYCRECLNLLQQCFQSVVTQTHQCTHFMIADGFPSNEVASWPVEHLILSRPHHDLGNTARGIGAMSAMNQGYDAVAFLDADNWYFPDHVGSMIDLHLQTGADVCTASRTIHRTDGSLMYADIHESDGVAHVDTNCFFFLRPAFHLLPLWVMMPTELGPVGDRVIWQSIVARGVRSAHHSRPTVAYRTNYQVHYANLGEPAPAGAQSNEESTGKAMLWWNSLPPDVRTEWSTYFASGLHGGRTADSPAPRLSSSHACGWARPAADASGF